MNNLYQIASLAQIKRYLAINNDEKDSILQAIMAGVTHYIETYTGRNFVTRLHTEYPEVRSRQRRRKFTGQMHRTSLKNPIYSIVSVNIDSGRTFDATNNLDASGYTFEQFDTALELHGNNFSNVPAYNQVKYWGGYSKFEIIEGVNDKLPVSVSEVETVLTLAAGIYNAEDFATLVQTALQTEYPVNNFTFKYLHQRQVFQAASTANFTFSFAGHFDTIAALAGFDLVTVAEDTSLFSRYEINGLPPDVVQAACMIANSRYFESKHENNYQDKRSEATAKIDKQTTFLKENHPFVLDILNNYRRF